MSSAGGPVERSRGRRSRRSVGCVGGDGAQHAHVAQAAVALLEVGLQEEGHVAGGGAAALPSGPRAGGGTWCRAGRRHAALAFSRSGSATRRSPQTMRPSSRPEGDPDVLGGGGQHLRGPADRVVELDALVPDRVPDGVGDGLDVPVAVVDEDDVEVAVGAQRSAGRSRRRPGGPGAAGRPGGPVGQVREPGVGLGGVAAAEFLALAARVASRSRRLRSRSDVSTGMAGT